MISVNYSGGLGNTLLQYCIGRILASRMGFYLDNKPINGFAGTKDLVDGQCMSLDKVKQFSSQPDRCLNEAPARGYKNVEIRSDSDFNIDEVIQIKDARIAIGPMGFFQRYEYYKPYKNQIRQWLKTEYKDVGQTKHDAIIHLRLGDCILGDLAEHPYVMPPEYFHKALKSMSFDRLYICSDPETMDHPIFHNYMKSFDIYKPKLVSGSAIEDFNTIKSFNKIIISQSTFSWFAAFLSNATKIFVPVPEGGHHGHEWSIESPGVSLFVDDEQRYKYIKQYKDEWKLVNLQDIEER